MNLTSKDNFLKIYVSKFVIILVQQGNNLSKFFAPEGPHAPGAQTIDVARLIQVTMESGTSDVLGPNKATVNELVIDI